MILGVINGGLGLQLSAASNSLIIAYSVVAGAILSLLPHRQGGRLPEEVRVVRAESIRSLLAHARRLGRPTRIFPETRLEK